MVKDPMHAIGDAEIAIAARKPTREGTQLEHRGALALEIIADEMTRMNAEISNAAVSIRILRGAASSGSIITTTDVISSTPSTVKGDALLLR